MASAPSREDVKKKALEAISARLEPGLGTKESVDGYSKEGIQYEVIMLTADYSSPNKLAQTVHKILQDKTDARILDAGAGSGLAGFEIYKMGYTNIDAVDASSGLLKVAKEKKIYTNIMCQFVGTEPLPVEDNAYDMVTMSAAMGENLMPAEAFDEFIRIIKPGGHVVNAFRVPALTVPWYGKDLESFFQKLEDDGKWKLVEKTFFPNFLHGIEGVVFVHEIL